MRVRKDVNAMGQKTRKALRLVLLFSLGLGLALILVAGETLADGHGAVCNWIRLSCVGQP